VLVSICHELESAQWDEFVGSFPRAHHEQTSAWARTKHHYGWQPHRVLLTDGTRILAGAQILVRQLTGATAIGYLSRGPVVGPNRYDVAQKISAAINDYAQQLNLLYLVIDLPYQGQALHKIFTGLGFEPHPPRLPPTGLMTATLLLDLKRSMNTIFDGLHYRARRYLNRAHGEDLIFHEGTSEHLNRFRELMVATCRRRGESPTPPEADFFNRLWQAFGDGGWVRLFLVSCRNQIVSAAVSFTFSDWVRVWKVGWSGQYPEKRPNHFLWWKMIEWAKRHDFEEFDLVWVDSEDAKMIAAGTRDPSAFRDGSTFFKLGFGGRLIFLPQTLTRFYHPLSRSLFHCGGRRLLESALFLKVVRRAHYFLSSRQ